MRRIALPFVVLLFGAVSHMAAQTNHIIGGPYQDGYYPPYLYSFGIELDGGGNSIGWITGSLNHEWACGTGNHPLGSTGGFIFVTINGVAQPCADSVSYTVSGTVTINGCTGPAQAIEKFDDSSTVTVYFSYVKGGRWHNICQGIVVGGSRTEN